MSLVTDVKAYLVAQGQATNTFMGRLPDTPDTATALLQYAGRAPLFVHNTPGISIDRPALQILNRAPIYAEAEARALALYTLLAAIVNTSMGGTTYLRIEPLAAPFLLERDANDRTVFAANYYIQKRP